MEFLALGSLWFFIFVLAEIFFLFLCVSKENGVGALVSIVLFLLGIHFFSDVDVLELIVNNKISLCIVLLCYVLLSVPWGIFRWSLFCKDCVEKYNEYKQVFLKKHNVDGDKVPPELQKEWKEYINWNSLSSLARSPKVSEHKARIIRSMSLWLIDMCWFLVGDLVVRLWNMIYRRIAAYLQNISDHIFAKSGIKEDFQ